MKAKYQFIFLAFSICLAETTYGQATLSGSNVRPATGSPFPFLGWDGSGSVGTLQIRNDLNRDIQFLMGGSEVFPNGVMEIKGPLLTGGSWYGYGVGIGLVGSFEPQSQLHLWHDVTNMYIQIANAYSGTGETDG